MQNPESDMQKSRESRQLIAEKSHRIERELGIIGGKQDQYAAVYGGMNLFVFHQDGHVDIRPLSIPSDCLQHLKESIILFDTGETRLSSRLHEHVWGSYRQGLNRTVLVRMREIAFEMFDCLGVGDVDTFGALIDETWECQKALHPSISNGRIEDVFEVVRRAEGLSRSQNRGGKWDLAGKACGAGGGGCLMFLTQPDRRKQVEGVLANLPGVIVPFEFDWDGLVVERKDH